MSLTNGIEFWMIWGEPDKSNIPAFANAVYFTGDFLCNNFGGMLEDVIGGLGVKYMTLAGQEVQVRCFVVILVWDLYSLSKMVTA